MKHQFKNDYASLGNIDILNKLVELSNEQNGAYGLDKYSDEAKLKIKEVFGLNENSEIYFLCGGTQSNMVGISYLLNLGYEAIISCETGHINCHEAGAVEKTGHKIITAKGNNGKLYPSDILEILKLNKESYCVEPKLVYISNPTEIGTIYTKEELTNLYQVCKDNNLYLFVDGARLGCALTSSINDLTPKEFAGLCDAFYIGGTKLGLPIGEALVYTKGIPNHNFYSHMKSCGAMIAKGSLIGIMFNELFKNNLYFDVGKRENELALIIKNKLKSLNYEVVDSFTNQVFVKMKEEFATELINEYGCELWKDLGEIKEIRFVTSFNTTLDDVNELCLFLENQIKNK